MSIPKTLHFVWVGDESQRPDNCIETWRRHHPDFDIAVWGNAQRDQAGWRLQRHMREMGRTGQLCGVADLMRWEILLCHGGVALDVDSVCLQRLPDWLLSCSSFASWENEIAKPGLITNGFFGARAGDPLLAHIVATLERRDNVAWKRKTWLRRRPRRRLAWKATGPALLTDAVSAMQYCDISVLPSHFFSPVHHSGACYRGGGPVYCTQLFGSAGDSIYGALHTKPAEALVADALRRLGRAPAT